MVVDTDRALITYDRELILQWVIYFKLFDSVGASTSNDIYQIVVRRGHSTASFLGTDHFMSRLGLVEDQRVHCLRKESCLRRLKELICEIFVT